MVKRENGPRGEGVATIVEISCIEAWREISELIDGTLSSDMQQRIKLHLEHCAHCRAVYDGARNMAQLIGDDQVFDLPPGFSDRLLERLALEFGRV